MGEAPGWLSRLSVKLLISAQVMISRFVGSIETRIGLCADSTEPAWDSLSLSLSLSSLLLPHLHTFACTLSLSLKINK